MGKTILISSHILHELAELCNVVGIIERGELLFSGSVSDVMRRAGMEHAIELAVTERTQEAAKLLSGVAGIKRVSVVEDDGRSWSGGGKRLVIRLAVEDAAKQTISDLPNRLINNGFRLTHFSEEKVNLETAFMRLTQGLVQ